MLLQIADAQNPLCYLSLDLKNYIEKECKDKQKIALLNKSDYLTKQQHQV